MINTTSVQVTKLKYSNFIERAEDKAFKLKAHCFDESAKE